MRTTWIVKKTNISILHRLKTKTRLITIYSQRILSYFCPLTLNFDKRQPKKTEKYQEADHASDDLYFTFTLKDIIGKLITEALRKTEDRDESRLSVLLQAHIRTGMTSEIKKLIKKSSWSCQYIQTVTFESTTILYLFRGYNLGKVRTSL